MNQAICFKILQRQLKFRNPNDVLTIPHDFQFSYKEYQAALDYFDRLHQYGIQFTYPGDEKYPQQFRTMKEPPLFLEFIGKPFWLDYPCLSIVGTRQMHPLTESWMHEHLVSYFNLERVCVVSGGAFGVDQAAHFISVKQGVPTIVVVPSGLVKIYPKAMKDQLDLLGPEWVCYMSEFEIHQPLNKHHFFARNRLIAAFGEIVFVAQAEVKSGSFLTVHHALENGRPVVTLPAHPSMLGFSGNIRE